MIKFHKLTLRNFLSYGNQVCTIDLSNSGSTLITGRNLDVSPDGSASNGTGKSVIINAITYGLYDKPISSITKDNLVNTINGRQMEVTVTFEVDGVFYESQRFRKMKAGAAGNYSRLYERKGDMKFVYDSPQNGGDEVTLDSNTNTTDYISQKIGIPYELFVRIVVFSGSHTPFLSMPSKHPQQPSQQSFIEELFDLKTLTQKAEVLKQRIKNDETEFNLANARIEMAEKHKKSYAKQIEETQRKLDSWEIQRNQDIVSLQTKLKRIEGVDLDEQQKTYDALNEVLALQTKLQSSLRSIGRDKRDVETHLEKLSEEVKHLKDATCPYCKQEFHGGDDNIAEKEGHIVDLTEALRMTTDEEHTLIQQLEEVATAIEVHKASLQFDDIQELLAIKFKKDEIASNIERQQTAVNPFIEMLEMVERQKPEEVDYTKLNELSENLEHQRFLLKLLTKNDSFLRKAMLNKNLPFLNKQLNYYLRRMELPHVVEFTHDLTPRISRFGSEFEFDNLSTGQKARVNLALSLSFRDVLQNLHQKINLFCLDEVLDVGLDAAGVMMAAKLLKEEARKSGTCMFVISHREEISSSFDKKMFVLFEDSFSRAYQSPADVAIAEQKLHEAA